MSATGRMWRHNWRLDFSVVRFATQAASSRCPILNDSSISQDGWPHHIGDRFI